MITTTAIKQAYEDWLRHRADKLINGRFVSLLTNGTMIKIKSQDIRVGDIVMVKDNDEIPCDMIVISTKNVTGRCDLTTANLDGESNLKVRQATKVTKDIRTPEQLEAIRGIIECEKPDSDLYAFVGTLKLVKPEGNPELM